MRQLLQNLLEPKPTKPNGAPAAPPKPKPLEVGETAPIIGADDLKGVDPDALERQIGRLTLQILGLAARHQMMQARARQVMIAHGADMDDAAKVYNLDTKAMTITRIK